MADVPAGWYDDGSGRQRWWDGTQWTDRFADVAETQATAPRDPFTLWEATGKPLTGIGAGRYRLTKEYLFFEKGALTTKAQQILTHEIHDVDANQSMTQKARGVGTITLKAVRANGAAETVMLEDVPEFRAGVAAINAAAHEARESLRVRQQTSHVNYTGAVPGSFAQAPGAAPASAPADDLNAQLTKLAELKASGVLDDDEFKTAKAKLLGIG